MSGSIDVAQAQIEAYARELSQAAIRPAGPEGHGESAAAGFAQSLQQALHAVDDKERVAGEKMAEVDSGRSDDMVGAMLASQDASLSFSMLMQVRNKVVGAVDDLLKLQL